MLESEVSKIIKNLNDETAARFDKISVKLIKFIETIIIEPLTYLYNLSIENVMKNSGFPIRMFSVGWIVGNSLKPLQLQ